MRLDNSEKLEALRKQALRDQDQRGGGAAEKKKKKNPLPTLWSWSLRASLDHLKAFPAPPTFLWR